jgi:hypothetical protein
MKSLNNFVSNQIENTEDVKGGFFGLLSCGFNLLGSICAPKVTCAPSTPSYSYCAPKVNYCAPTYNYCAPKVSCAPTYNYCAPKNTGCYPS